MAQQVLHSDVPRHPRVVELEVRQDLRHAVVPLQFVLIHQDRHRRRGERFRVRGDREQRVRVHPLAPAQLLDAVAPREDRLPSLTMATASPGTCQFARAFSM